MPTINKGWCIPSSVTRFMSLHRTDSKTSQVSFKEHVPAYTNNYSISAYAHHLIKHGHSLGHTQDVMDIIFTTHIGRHIDTCKRLCIYIYIFPVALRPNAGHGLLILEVSRSHTTTHHCRQDSPGRVISSSQRPLPGNTQHSQQTNIQVPARILTHDLSRRAAADLRLRPRGHWDRQYIYIYIYLFIYITEQDVQTKDNRSPITKNKILDLIVKHESPKMAR